MLRNTLLLLFAAILGGSILLAQGTQPDTPLTCDQDDLVSTQAELQSLLENFSENLAGDSQAALGQLYEIGQQYQELAINCGFIPEDIGGRFVGTDLETILRVLEEVSGDPLNGQLLYNNEAPAADGNVLGCVGCHSEETIAPLTEGTWTRWDEIRRLEPVLEDFSFERYTVESILLPWDYLVPDYGQVMPNNFGDRLSYQDLADLIAYLSSQDQLIDQ